MRPESSLITKKKRKKKVYDHVSIKKKIMFVVKNLKQHAKFNVIQLLVQENNICATRTTNNKYFMNIKVAE